MNAPHPDRARLVAIDDLVLGCATLSHPQHASAYQIRVADAGPSAVQWARRVFEDAPPQLRSFLIVGWKAVLGLRLGPTRSPDHVLGWTLEATTAHSATMGARSPTMSAQKVVRIDDSQLVVATFVRFDRPGARPLWVAVLPVHRRLEPALMTKAVARALRRAT